MRNIKFNSLEEVIDCYGRENLVAIDNLAQVIFYTSHGAQPKYVCENEVKHGKISCWFLKSETSYIYKLWQQSNFIKG